MPWPQQPPFDEIGVYAVVGDVDGYERLRTLARAAVGEPVEPGTRAADAGGERVSIDGREASWNPHARGVAADAFVTAAREVIAAARSQPLAVMRAQLGDGVVTLSNRGEEPLPVTDGRLHRGHGAPEWPPSPMALAAQPSIPLDLPAELAPGERIELAAPGASRYGLLQARWRYPLPGEPDEHAGWVLTGPL